ncbi:MAG: hypothetical protein GY701_24720 [Sulfitobacter sp.]|nr:hypothetical protein [Sulfitobacter sp.]
MSRKVLLIGWDAADWKVIHALIDKGGMPHTAALIDRGVMGDLATLHPVLSPMLWTSIATGKRPYKHGILGFSEPTPDGGGVQPVSQYGRTTKALWNILNQQGLRLHVIDWWPNHPVEPINGVMVSNHFHTAVGPPEDPWPLAPGMVHPPAGRGHPDGVAAQSQRIDPRAAVAVRAAGAGDRPGPGQAPGVGDEGAGRVQLGTGRRDLGDGQRALGLHGGLFRRHRPPLPRFHEVPLTASCAYPRARLRAVPWRGRGRLPLS